MASLQELTTPLTRKEIEDSIYQAIEARGTKTTSWKVGSIARTIIVVVAIILAAFSSLQAKIAKSGFLELAEGDWLTLVALYVFGVTRNLGTFASGQVEFNNAGGGVFAFAAGDVIVFNSSSNKTFRNTEAFTLAALETGKLVSVEAVEIGSDSTSPSGFVDSIQTTMLGVSVTNPNAIVGSDPETDPQLRERCLAKTGTLSPNGPSDAYRYHAIEATKSDGTTAGVTRVSVVADGSGGVTVYVATSTGGVSGTVGDTSTALGAVDEAVATKCEPLAVTATVVSATPEAIGVTYEAWVRSAIGVSESELENQVALALSEAISTLPIGGLRKIVGDGYVFKEWIEGVIKAAIGTKHLIDLSVPTPAADILLSNSKVPVAGTVTATINIVSI